MSGRLIFNALKRTFLLFLAFSLMLFVVFIFIGLTKEPFSVGFFYKILTACFWFAVIYGIYIIPLLMGLVCTFYFLDKSEQRKPS